MEEDNDDSDSHITDKTDEQTSIVSLFSTMACDADERPSHTQVNTKEIGIHWIKQGDREQRRNARFSDNFQKPTPEMLES